MTIKDLQKKYELSKDDFWQHKQSGQWIITHNAVEKIATIENIYIKDIKILNSEQDLVRMLITMRLTGKGREVVSIGEADKKNCYSQYLGCMAEKRGIDRCVLKLINAYEYGISSEVEADDFAKPTYYRKTDNELERFDKLLQHPYFKGKKNDVKEQWKVIESKSQTDLFLQQMKSRCDAYEKELSQVAKEDEDYSLLTKGQA
tara:strand:+ start:824 stop:1432 length:609 start_codon:yes stop_codon:yes gene_type:complete